MANSGAGQLGVSNGLQPGEASEPARSSDLLTSMDDLRLRLEGELVSELKKLDLSANEAKILLYLMSNGSSTASDIARHTKIQRTDTYHYISTLLSEGLVFSTFSKPQKYYSLPYDQVVDYLVQARTSALKEVAERKLDCKNKLDQIAKCASREAPEDTYQVLSGENAVLSRASRMFSEPSRRVTMFLSDRMLAKLYHGGIIDLADSVSRAGGDVRIKTPSKKSFSGESDQDGVMANLRLQTINDPSPASFIIKDSSSVLFIIDKSGGANKEISGIYTDNDVMISTLLYLFEKIS